MTQSSALTNVCNKQIREELELHFFFTNHIRGLTAGFDPRVSFCWEFLNSATWKAAVPTDGRPKLSEPLTESDLATRRSADAIGNVATPTKCTLSNFRLHQLWVSVMFIRCNANARA